MITDNQTLNELYSYVSDLVDVEIIIQELYANNIESFNRITKNVIEQERFGSIQKEVLEKQTRNIIFHIIKKRLPEYEYQFLLKQYAKEIVKN